MLVQGERQICLNCLSDLTYTLYSGHNDNHTERMLTNRLPFQHASSLLVFHQGNTVQKVIHAMKFHGNSELCLLMGRQMGLDLMQSGRFDDIDLLVPVPLHWRRRMQRGYNQSELLCRGIAEITGRPVSTHTLRRHRYTHQQSMQASVDREENVNDVLTTGATLGSCGEALKHVKNLKISIATLSIAGQ